MFNDLMKHMFGNAIKSGLFQVNAGTYRKRYQHRHNPRLNRSKHWPYAETYQQAREMSPSTKPVR